MEVVGHTNLVISLTLSQNELIVLGRETRHHQPKHLQECAAEKEPSGTIVVEELPNDRSADEHEKDLQRSNLVRVRGC